jgi:hypothetical protein
VLLSPLGVLICTFRGPAFGPMTKFAVTVVAFTTVSELTVMLPAGATTIVSAPVRLVPVRVTDTVVPCVPEVGEIEVRVGTGRAITVNVRALVGPPGIVTVTFLALAVAVVEMVKVALTVVAFTATKLLTVTPVPDTVTAVAPVRLTPVMVTGTTVFSTPLLGVIEVSDGPTTVNPTVLLVPPGVVVMLTVLAPRVAVAERVKVAVTVVVFTTVMALAVTPVPDMVIADAFDRLVPVRITPVRVWPCAPDVGEIEVSVGTAGAVTVNATVLLVPAEVVTLTVLAPRVAVAVMVKVAVTVVPAVPTTAILVTVIPVPDTFTDVMGAVRLVPVRVTVKLLPCAPVLGAIKVSVGRVPAADWNSTAPTSKRLGTAGSGLALPKKSVRGVTG